MHCKFAFLKIFSQKNLDSTRVEKYAYHLIASGVGAELFQKKYL